MSKIWILFRGNLRRNRLYLLLAVVGSALICSMFGYVGGLSSEHQVGGIPVGIIDNDHTALTSDFQTYMREEQGMELTTDLDYDGLSTELIERHISAIIEIPAGFTQCILDGKEPRLDMTTLDDYENAAYLEAYLDSYLNAVHLLAEGAQGDTAAFDTLLSDFSAQSISVEETSVAALTQQQISQQDGFSTCIGFFVMLGFLFAMSLAFSVFDDRDNGLYQRIQIASVRPVQYVLGTSLFGLLNCLLFVALFCAFVLFSGFYTGVSIGVVLTLSVLYSLFIVGFALVAALYVPSKNAISALVIGAATITSLLGGAYFPIDTSPELLQKLALLTPQYWYMNAIRSIQQTPDFNWTVNAVAIFLFALLCFLLAGIRFSNRKPSVQQ